MNSRKHIERGISFLMDRQNADGGFTSMFYQSKSGFDLEKRYSEIDENDVIISEDTYSMFPSMIIGHALLGLEGSYDLESMLKKIEVYLIDNQGPRYLWAHFKEGHPMAEIIPYDLDDTAMASSYLLRRGVTGLTNHSLFLKNRRGDGLFHTWICLRKYMPLSLDFICSCWKEWKSPIRTRYFWKWTESGRYDIDAVVNANILTYIGIREETEYVVKYLTSIISNDMEKGCDKWYSNPMTAYYSISRCIKKFENSFTAIVAILQQKVLTQVLTEGSIRGNAMDTALGVITLLNTGYTGDELESMKKYIIGEQFEDGSWPIRIYYFGGPKNVAGWGSNAIVTSLCLEALHGLP